MSFVQKKYNSLDGLRAYSALGIVALHVLVNGEYALEGFAFDWLIPSFTNLVFLFMILSGFSLCCGYYERIARNEISITDFYAKRYAKIWPFFAALVALDVVISPSLESVYEAFANLTLCFGFLPNPKIEVIGVSWTLGVIFVFYLVFPFVCFLLSTKRRAWLSTITALIFSIVCKVYFFDASHMPADYSGRSNFLYCAVFFLTGGLLYLYRDALERFARKFWWLILIACTAATAGYYFLALHELFVLVPYALLVIYAVGNDQSKVLNNPVTRFLSGISMEIYLSHMVIYRVVEKMGIVHLFASELLSYIAMMVVVVTGTTVFSVTAKKVLAVLPTLYSRIKEKAMSKNAGEEL